MAFRQKSQQGYEQMVQIIQEKPGILPSHMADRLGIAPSTVLRRLPGLEEAGHKLFEDERGGLHIFQDTE